ncbi:hypothetical protein OIU79_027297 [Salix purpurea]|uniref:ABC transporter domain-containing protein n=1 Tax=Salix purpurea TaxID=77065 RepID=A0A9Q0VTZ0_SALPP|nr:hypothetical protein OIU79_027297 [Salix purpurea]
MASLPRPSKQSSSSDHRLNYQSTSLRYNQEIKAALEVKTVVPMPSSRGGGDGVATDRDGVFLTWKDLWVTVSDGKKGSKSILQGLTGYARPGELLAIMGPSGCGKSTLLDTLAGRLGSSTRQTGDILINGHKQRLAYGTSAYVTQDDTLITTLTVKEAVYYSAQLQLPDSMTRAEKERESRDDNKRNGATRCHEYKNWRPSGEVFQLFDSLCLLSAGKVVYFGPASQANEFFALNDFETDLEQGLEDAITTEVAINTLTKAYKSSDNYQQVKRIVTGICEKDCGTLEERNHSSFLTQCLVLTRRSFVNMYRDLGYYWLRVAIYVSLSLGLATLFYNLGSDNDSIQARGSLLMFIASFLTFMTIGGFPSFVEDMKVFERERLNGHYGATAFVIGNTFSALPYLLLISVIPGAIAYFLPGLHKGYEHFIYFVSVLFACMMLVESLMMTVASIVPNFLMGIITGAGIQAFMVLGGGFFRLPKDLPQPFWKYPMYYIAFHKYAYQGMFKNEFEGLTFLSNEAGGPQTIPGEKHSERSMASGNGCLQVG